MPASDRPSECGCLSVRDRDIVPSSAESQWIPSNQSLNPRRFPGMSPFMAAVVGFVLGDSFTEPEIEQITVSEVENLVYIRRAGAVGFDGIESLKDMRDNWNRLLDAAGLTPEEQQHAVRQFNSRLRRCRARKPDRRYGATGAWSSESSHPDFTPTLLLEDSPAPPASPVPA